ncbi:S-layer homology domain-containing protein [Pelotomaculum isophthalicicum JI]|uniref:S-layer homology domain-containing protein n=1 Tax=Pelotomaculum isophthalicicum JI TaxID=947010 RepID=A0A9X4H4T2_9FIRM|nr:S-layer homology domain-containing protein [Pelotomaculum isophthalicicum]MDF9407019.1 S-layer homology domain-containing protein [Pelotomaculum isophthalicicum JI]
MLKNKRWSFLILVLTIFTLLAGTLTTEAAGGKLTDIEGHWAQQAISEMYASEIISGFPGGLFQPDDSVTKLQVVATLIRVLGLEEQAKEKEDDDVDYQLPPLNWGRGYLIMGVQEGMLDKDYLIQLGPAEPATRAEVAALVYHALKLNEDNSNLTFADSDQIPQTYRSCVAAMVKNKLMQGLPGNVFKPNDQINRGQMAVLLSRILENNFGGSEIQSRRYSGTISSVLSLDQSRWLVSINSGVNKITDPECEVFLDGNASSIADLKVDDKIKFVLNRSDQIAFINAARTNTEASGTNTNTETNATATSYKGKVASQLQIGEEYWLGITCSDGTQVTRPVTGGVKVNDSGSQKEVSSLSKGDYVEIKVSGDKIIEINSLTLSTIVGTVTSVRTSGLTLRSDSGTNTDIDVPDNVTVVRDNSTMTYNDVKVDNRIEVTVLDNKAQRIDILSAPNLEGVISELNTTGNYVITIRDDNGYTRDYVVVSDAEVMQNGSRISYDNLRVGDQVRLELNSKNRVTYIEIVGSESNKLTGDIRELDTAGTLGITIRNDDGDTLDYVVESDVEVVRDGSHIKFNVLSIGDRVKLELNSVNRVDYIEVVDEYNSTVNGKIADLITGSSPFIIIEKNDGSKSRYYLADNVTIDRDGESLHLRDMVIGSEVEAQIGNGKAKNIEIINDEDITVSGTVTYVSTSSKKITIKQLSGNEFSYYLRDGASLIDNSSHNISLYDVDEGWDVQLVLVGGKVSRLTQE